MSCISFGYLPFRLPRSGPCISSDEYMSALFTVQSFISPRSIILMNSLVLVWPIACWIFLARFACYMDFLYILVFYIRDCYSFIVLLVSYLSFLLQICFIYRVKLHFVFSTYFGKWKNVSNIVLVIPNHSVTCKVARLFMVLIPVLQCMFFFWALFLCWST